MASPGQIAKKSRSIIGVITTITGVITTITGVITTIRNMRTRSGLDYSKWRTGLLVIQPTPFCNINCSYCYLPHRNNTKRMPLALAERLFDRLFEYPTIKENLRIVWHAGEPMVLSADYYDAMFTQIQRRAGETIKISHAFQTNGTLITDDWCDLIQKWDVTVGVSIDGPAEFHDLNRKYRNGEGSFDRAMRGVKKLQERGISFYVISVLTLGSLQAPEQMLSFYTEAGIDHVCFNIEEQEGHHSHSKTIESQNFEELYRNFFETFVGLALQGDRKLMIREFENSVREIRATGDEFSNNLTDPFAIISIDCDGNLSTFSPELLGVQHPAYGSFKFGNAVEDDFEMIAARVAESDLYADILSGQQRCKTECDYYSVCGGVAPSNKIFENGSANSTDTRFCLTHKVEIDVVLSVIEKLPQHAARAFPGQEYAG